MDTAGYTVWRLQVFHPRHRRIASRNTDVPRPLSGHSTPPEDPPPRGTNARTKGSKCFMGEFLAAGRVLRAGNAYVRRIVFGSISMHSGTSSPPGRLPGSPVLLPRPWQTRLPSEIQELKCIRPRSKLLGTPWLALWTESPAPHGNIPARKKCPRNAGTCRHANLAPTRSRAVFRV
jgi:hypothetical protein